MVQLGQTGADTITHIASVLVLLALGVGVPAVVGFFQPTALQGIWIWLFEIAVAIGGSYYSAKFQASPSGGVSISTDATSTKI